MTLCKYKITLLEQSVKMVEGGLNDDYNYTYQNAQILLEYPIQKIYLCW